MRDSQASLQLVAKQPAPSPSPYTGAGAFIVVVVVVVVVDVVVVDLGDVDDTDSPNVGDHLVLLVETVLTGRQFVSPNITGALAPLQIDH